MDDEPALHLNFKGEPLEATPDNTSLFLFLGHLSMYNHIFIQTDDDHGAYIFERFVPEVWGKIAKYVSRHGFPMHVNLREVAECDKTAFDRMVEVTVAEVDEGIPEGWYGTDTV